LADITMTHGCLMLIVLGGLAECERDLIRTRTNEGRDRTKARWRQARPQLENDRTPETRRRSGGETVLDKPVREIAPSYNASHSTISRLTA
jgi:DNA invertase Pin-like site-specific DNA recombinase